jgi:type VI secretion system secreted protein Hcp
MALDIYLKLKDIPGDSQDSSHKDQIECTSVNFEVLQPKSATSSTAGGQTAERCEHKDIVITKLVDVATPKLLEFCSSGKIIADVTFEFMRSDGGTRVKYFEIKLINALVSSVSPSVASGEFMTEHVSFKYAAVQWIYTKSDSTGKGGGSTPASWSLVKNNNTFAV